MTINSTHFYLYFRSGKPDVENRGMGQYYQNMHNQDKVQYHTGEKNMWNNWRT